MLTQKKPAHRTYDKTTRKRIQQKKKRVRQLRIKCILGVSAFTLTLFAACEWHILKPHPDSLKQYSAKAVRLLTTHANSDSQTQQVPPDGQTRVILYDGQTITMQTDEQLDELSDEQLDKQSDEQHDKQPDEQLDKQSDKQLDKQLDKQHGKQLDKQINKQYDKRFDKQFDEQLQGTQFADTTTDDSKIQHISSVSDEWNLILVNPWNEIPEDYNIQLMRLPNGQSIDSRCYQELTEMMDACRAAGYQPLICSSYRTQEKQESLFQERMDELTAQGYTQEAARIKAATSVARPGTSEHQVGLAVDIVDQNHQALDATQEYTMVQQWLMENSWKYGFILRYPMNKSRLTGIIYEPWHYRYVGKEAAQEIYERGVCLEEYLEDLDKEE